MSDSEDGVRWGLLEKGSFRKVHFLERLDKYSGDCREPPDSGKQRRIQPLVRDSRSFGDSGDFTSEKTPFVMTPFSGPDSVGVCPLVLQKLVLRVLFLHGWQESCGQQIEANVQWAMRQMQGGPGSVRFGYGLGMEQFERFRFSVPAAPLRRGVFVCFGTCIQFSREDGSSSGSGGSSKEGGLLCVSVQFSREDGSSSGFGSWRKRFRQFRFRIRFLGKRFRQFRFPVPVWFLCHPVWLLVQRHNLGLPDEAENRGSSSTQGQKTQDSQHMLLVAPRDYLSDTPLACALWGLWCLKMANWVRYPLPRFWAFPLESMLSGGAIPPPPKRGISAILVRYPMKTRQMGAIPPSAILISKGYERVLRDRGGYLAVGCCS